MGLSGRQRASEGKNYLAKLPAAVCALAPEARAVYYFATG